MTRDIPIYSETAMYRYESDSRRRRLSQNTQVCAVDVDGGVPRRLTTGARDVEGVTNGVADYCAMEEMDRYEGFWLSPTGNRVCFEQVDETDVKLISIPMLFGSTGVLGVTGPWNRDQFDISLIHLFKADAVALR